MSAVLVTAREFVGDVIGQEAAQFLRFHASARRGVDPESVHQLRVSTRRLRTDLDFLRSLLDSSWYRDVREDLAWIGGRLGARRDFDVLIAFLEELASTDESLDRSVIFRAETMRDRGRDGVERALGRTRYHKLLVTLIDATLWPPLRDPDVVVRRIILDKLGSSWDKLRLASDTVTNEASDLHRLRIVVKRSRYAMEIASPFLDESRPIVQRLARVQDELGQLHDDVVTCDFVVAWYRSARAARGVDPFDASDAWLNAIHKRGEQRRDLWRAPLAEALVLIDDVSRNSSYLEWSEGEQSI